MSSHNPWKTLEQRMVYSNPWITVREDKVIRPDGKPGIYGVVETRIATGVVALTEDMQVYLVGQYRYPLDAYSWEVPEGGADPGEEPIEAIQRELREEAGITARKWTSLGGPIHLSNCFSNEIAYAYLAEELEENEPDPEGTEVLEVRRVPFQTAIDMVHEGAITDAMSIIALLRAEHYIKQTGRRAQ